MKLNLDRTLRGIWLAIGVLVLGLAVVLGVVAIAGWMGTRGASEDAVRVAREAGTPAPAPELLRLSLPDSVRGSATRIIRVYRTSEGGRGSYSYGSSGGAQGPTVNLVFVDDQGARLLLDRPAYIRVVDVPGDGAEQGAAYPPRNEGPAQDWIAYEVALEDGNKDGRLDERDPRSLYVSGLDGRNLRAVVRPPLRVTEYAAIRPGRMLVYAMEPVQGARGAEPMRQRAFIYDVAGGRLIPFEALEAAGQRAAAILAR
ncbi:MAG TPA: hypothetical protein VF665_09875 [Longimicrobium sp.]|jgi:hypothetical protein|uniref:hypothetical protein n=1 Tax=Longimicrobium sp. TaxID=2029185 RepID=UPI002EDA67AE